MPSANLLIKPDNSTLSFDFEEFVKVELGLGLTSNKAHKICQNYLKGQCYKGPRCEYKHAPNRRDKAVMPECWFYTRFGECSNEDCLYLHIDPESLMKECPWYARGFCKHGPDCRDKHVRKVLCPLYMTGFCPQGENCPNGHPKYELSSVQRVHNTALEYDAKTHHEVDEHNTKYGGYRPLSEVTCFKCNQKGHFANRCPSSGSGYRGRYRNYSSSDMSRSHSRYSEQEQKRD
ncbi:hypothetical protein G9A89_009667 [Geosiphon pyriformis]|nr:hypothetical protein G9A89_009667 [Geosiphon pyriformis]